MEYYPIFDAPLDVQLVRIAVTIVTLVVLVVCVKAWKKK